MEIQSRFYLFVALILIISSHSFCQESSVPSGQLLKLYPKKSTIVKYHNNWTQKHYKQRIEMFKNDPLHYGDIVFIGNSITEQGRDWSKLVGIGGIKNRGIAGDLTDGVLKRLDEIIYFKPKAIFILIGVNDLFNIHHLEANRPSLIYDHIISSPQYVGRNIVKIARILHKKLPETQIYVRTVLPTRREYLLEDILIVNQMIKQKENKNYYKVIDLYSAFVDDEGKIKKELTKDGVHLTDKGYSLWVEIERPILEKL